MLPDYPSNLLSRWMWPPTHVEFTNRIGAGTVLLNLCGPMAVQPSAVMLGKSMQLESEADSTKSNFPRFEHSAVNVLCNRVALRCNSHSF